MAKVSFSGKVLERNKRKGKDNVERYTIVVEEPGQYPNEFAFLVKDATSLGPADGFARIGAMVQVTGYLNGKCEVLQRKDGSGTWKNYRMWLRLATIQPYAETQEQTTQDQAVEETYEDIPF